MRIEIIPCLQDNYSYLIIDESNNFACVVDPSESEPIINFLENKNIKLKYIYLCVPSMRRKALMILKEIC